VASAIDALSAQEQPGLADVVNEKEQMVRGLQKELGQLETSLNGQPSVEEYEQVRETLKVEIQRALDANDLEDTGPWTLLRMHNRRHQVHAELQDAMSELRELVTQEQRQDAHNNAINKKKREILELHDAYEAARLALVERLESV
jgi:DNA repair exonuclease SbcCD ATPase subunit